MELKKERAHTEPPAAEISSSQPWAGKPSVSMRSSVYMSGLLTLAGPAGDGGGAVGKDLEEHTGAQGWVSFDFRVWKTISSATTGKHL